MAVWSMRQEDLACNIYRDGKPLAFGFCWDEALGIMGDLMREEELFSAKEAEGKLLRVGDKAVVTKHVRSEYSFLPYVIAAKGLECEVIKVTPQWDEPYIAKWLEGDEWKAHIFHVDELEHHPHQVAQ